MTDAFTSALSSHRCDASPEPSVPPARAALPLWSDFPSQMGDAFHAEASARFVYCQAREPGLASASGTFSYQPAPAAISDATHQMFDGWINALASWTQAGTATICQQGDHIDNAMLLANGDPLIRNGG